MYKVVKNPNLRSKLRKSNCKRSKILFLIAVLMKKFKERFHVKMRRNACAQIKDAGAVMNYDVIAYRSVCRDVKLHDLPVFFKTIYLGI
jgi:hypothetical protein